MRLSSYDIESIKKVKSFIDSDLRSHHSISEIASYAGMSPTKLKEDFKIIFAVSLYHYLKQQRLEKGKYLIENTDKTIWEIGRALGFKHHANFITAFKKRFGITPGRLRNRIIIWIIYFHMCNYFHADCPNLCC